MKNVVIAGATSAIAQSLGRMLARRGSSMLLVGRDVMKLEAVQADLLVHGAPSVSVIAQDLNDLSLHGALFGKCLDLMPSMDVLVVAYGLLTSQVSRQDDFDTVAEILQTNFVSAVSLITPFAAHFEKRRRGKIAVISSVAGDRGRAGNYVYGGAKGGLSVYLEGLRHRLAWSNVDVLTVKPGFVDTPMTAHLKKGPLFASPERVAFDIHRALLRRRSVIYTPWFWRPVMVALRLVPGPLFRRLPL